jgi:hypothetical protein
MKGDNKFVDNDWIYENNINEHCCLEASLPYGLGPDGLVVTSCRRCDLTIVLNIWHSNDKILIENDGGDERCGKESEEE